MLTGVFKDRSAKERAATEEQALADLLASRELRGLALTRHCEIGPFVVEHLFPEHSLIVELAAPSRSLAGVEDSPAARRRAARLKFFNDLGYVVFAIDPRELIRRPGQVLSRLLAVLGRS